MASMEMNHTQDDALRVDLTLCEKCQGLGGLLSELDQIPETGRALLSLGKKPKNLDLVACHLCRFFYGHCTEYKRDYRHHVRLFDRIKQKRPEHSRSFRFLSVIRENSRLEYDHKIQNEIGQNGLILFKPVNIKKPTSIHEVDPTTIDYDLLSSWTSECETRHFRTCQGRQREHSKLPYINLIDCHDEKVIQTEPSAKYVCLSYIWGKRGPDVSEDLIGKAAHQQIPFSFDKAPRTIQDAVRVVRGIGRRYLWVDRYCINQGLHIEKTQMIQNMDQIYENAEATIVALHGDDDTAGLPGVSNVHRTQQPQVKIRDGSFISSFPPISTLIGSSRWATRGWTYQEARLSRRCLFFTQHQVYFACREASRSETVHDDITMSWISRLLNSSHLDSSLLGSAPHVPQGLLLDRLMFTQRNLTYASDVLDAFRGVLARASWLSIWGITFWSYNHPQIDVDVSMALGLMWTTKPQWSIPAHTPASNSQDSQDSSDGNLAPKYSRRAGFPTWSWTSLIGEIYPLRSVPSSILEAYQSANHNIDFKYRKNGKIDQCRFWLPSPENEGEVIALPELVGRHTENLSLLPEISPELTVEGDLVKVKVEAATEQYSFHWPGQDDRDDSLGGKDIAQLDLPPSTSASQNSSSSVSHFTTGGDVEGGICDGLVLFEWNDRQPKPRRRFVMMLLQWVGPERAERRGLLSTYDRQWDGSLLNGIPRERKKFVLQ